mgnify:CR=1 FL=1
MNPLIVFDCHQALPNRFGLVLAAAARSRALAQGAEPRLDMPNVGANDLALIEIAAGAFTRDELAPFLPGTGRKPSFPRLGPDVGSAVEDGIQPLPRSPPEGEVVHSRRGQKQPPRR